MTRTGCPRAAVLTRRSRSIRPIGANVAASAAITSRIDRGANRGRCGRGLRIWNSAEKEGSAGRPSQGRDRDAVSMATGESNLWIDSLLAIDGVECGIFRERLSPCGDDGSPDTL